MCVAAVVSQDSVETPTAMFRLSTALKILHVLGVLWWKWSRILRRELYCRATVSFGVIQMYVGECLLCSL